MAVYDNATANVPELAKQIPVQLEMLDHALAILDKSIASLGEQIKPVLMQMTAVDPREKTPVPPLCTVADHVHTQTCQVERLTSILDQWRKDVQV